MSDKLAHGGIRPAPRAGVAPRAGAPTVRFLTGMLSPQQPFVDPDTGLLTAISFRFLHDILAPTSTLVDQVNTLQGQTTAMAGEITSLNNQIASANTAINAVQNDIAGINGQLAGINTHLTTLDGRVGTLEAHVASILTRLANAGIA